MPTASRTPVNVSGSAAGTTTSRTTCARVAPSARAASIRPTGAAATAAVGGHRGRRERREREQRDLRGLVDAQPDHEQEEVGQRRQRPQERQPRLEHPADPADRAHQQADQTPTARRGRRRPAPGAASCRGAPRAGSPVAPRPVVGGRHVEERPPDRRRVRHERLVPGAAGRGELPEHEEDLGATSRFAVDPPCRARIRCCPSDSLRARPAWTVSIAAGSSASSSRCASAQAASVVSRVMTCSRIPNRSSRPRSAAAARTRASFSATWSGGSPQVR